MRFLGESWLVNFIHGRCPSRPVKFPLMGVSLMQLLSGVAQGVHLLPDILPRVEKRFYLSKNAFGLETRFVEMLLVVNLLVMSRI